MKRDEHIETWIQGIESENYTLRNQPITGTWNNSGDDILARLHRKRRRGEVVAVVKAACLLGAGAGLAALAMWVAAV